MGIYEGWGSCSVAAAMERSDIKSRLRVQAWVITILLEGLPSLMGKLCVIWYIF